MASLLNIKKTLLRILKTNHKTTCGRHISTTPSLLWFQRFGRQRSIKEKEKYFLEKDKVPQNYQLIYKAPMESYVIWTAHVSTATASIVGIAALYQCVTAKPILDPVGTALIMESDDLYFFAAGFLALNVIMRLVVFMYTLRIYKHKGKYLAVYQSQLPLGVSHKQFEKGQVKIVHYIFSPWDNATYKLGGRTSLVLEDYFKTPAEFHEMQETEIKE